jgi:hypothetical protein
MCIAHPGWLIDVHVHYFMKGVIDKVDSSCTVPCFTISFLGAQPNAISLRQTTNELSRASRLLQKLFPSSIQHLLQDRLGSFHGELKFRGQVV